MLCAVAPRKETRVRELVEGPLLEPDRKGAQRLGRFSRSERGEQCRIDAAGQEHSDGDVADEMGADGIAQTRAQFLDELRLVVFPFFEGMRPREPLEAHGAVFPDEQMPGGELACLTEDGKRRWDGVEREKRLECVQIDLAARERAQLRCECQLIVGGAVVQRLDSEAVAREYETAARRIPDGDGEHPAQASGEAFAVLFLEMKQPLCVA